MFRVESERFLGLESERYSRGGEWEIYWGGE